MDALDDQFYRFRKSMGRLLRPLIYQELSVVFYDLTTIRIHGEVEVDGDLRRFGLSKELKGPARKCMLGVIQTADGLPLDFEVFDGNTAEVTTLLPMLKRCLATYPTRRVILAADRGLLSLDNVAELESLTLDAVRHPNTSWRYLPGATTTFRAWWRAWRLRPTSPVSARPLSTVAAWWWRMIPRCQRR